MSMDPAKPKAPHEPIIIPPLPHDVALMCLARLPRRPRAIARCVSQAWRNALNRPQIDSLRLSVNIPPEYWVFIVLQDTDGYPGFLEATESDTEWLLIDPLDLRTILLPNPLCGISADIRLRSVATNGNLFLPEISAISSNDEMGIRCYSVEEGCWSTIPPLPPPKEHRTKFACAGLGNFVYVCGGQTDAAGRASRSASRYDSLNNRWEMLPDMIMPRIDSAGFVMDGKLFVMGGYHSSGGFIQVHASGEFWDPNRGEWTLLPNLCGNGLKHAQQSNVREPSVVVVENKVYAMQSHSNELMVYDAASMQWTQVGYVGGHCERIDYSIYYKLLGVGRELWAIQHGMGRDIEIYACKPGGSKSVVWKRVELLGFERFDNVLSCTALRV
eukprot:Gb_05764 [translate_table: standard]